MPRTARARVGCLQPVALDPAAVDSLFPAPRPGSFRCQDITACVGLGVAKSDERQDARPGPIASQGVAGHAPAQIFGKHWPAMHRDDPPLPSTWGNPASRRSYRPRDTLIVQRLQAWPDGEKAVAIKCEANTREPGRCLYADGDEGQIGSNDPSIFEARPRAPPPTSTILAVAPTK